METELFRYTIYSVGLIIRLNVIIQLAQSRDFFCSLKRPAVSGAHPASYLVGMKLKTDLHLAARLRMNGARTPFLHVVSWRAHKQPYLLHSMDMATNWALR